MSQSLRRLAAAYGIAREYHDVWGHLHRVEDDTLRALLAAMRVDAGSAGAVADALAQLAQARCRQCLPSMTVVRRDARPWRLRVLLAADVAARPLAWRVVSEAGQQLAHDIAAPRGDPANDLQVAGERFLALELDIGFDLPDGYHGIELLAGGEAVARGTLAVAPSACYRPLSLRGGGRRWGPAVQLYGLRSRRNWGIGDFTDLGALVEQWGAEGADIVGVNPLHALFPHNPAQASPYSPSSRMFVNILYLDVEAIPEFARCAAARERVAKDEFQSTLAALRASPLVDYDGVTAAKLSVLELLYGQARSEARAGMQSRWTQFDAYKTAGGQALRRQALFDALQAHFFAPDHAIWGWPAWPESYRDPDAAATMQFADQHAERIDFYAWLQWQAQLQRAGVAVRARESGLAIGLYSDLAVSIDRGGADAWAQQHLHAISASVGAPPDDFNVNGQDWGLPPLIPQRLRDAGYEPFLAMLRANMRDAGALRIDHVMGLLRLYWVPSGAMPAEGAYVHYPFDDLLALLALESQRHRCLVIGEDLGTVSEEVRRGLAANDVLSYRVLLFERDASGNFKPPGDYPEPALAIASTHDLPTLAGWWEGSDISLRSEHGHLGPDTDIDAQIGERVRDRGLLLEALARVSLLPDGVSIDPHAVPRLAPALATAVQIYLARAPSALLVVQPEDVFGVREQANLPGTTIEYPNWRRKLPVALEDQPVDGRVHALAMRLAAERPSRRDRATRGLVTEDGTGAHRNRGRRAGRAHRSPTVPLPLAAIPRATYRVQLHRDFTFNDVTDLVPYLAALGISHVYCSPYLRARPGSRHGYDIVDHRMLNPEIGTRQDFDRMVATLSRYGMSHLCDVVPNHIAIMGENNAWWMDVLENGPASEFATYFDIDWMAQDPDLAGKVLVPVLGSAYGTVLERGELALAFEPETGSFAVRYFEHRFPLDPPSYAQVLVDALRLARPHTPSAAVAEFERIVFTLKALPARQEQAAAARNARGRAARDLKKRLAALVATQPSVARAIAATVARDNGTPGDPGSFEALHALLERQAFRLAHWRVASDQINYRRFFDINELAALRMENDAVFDATHDFILGLAARGSIGGLRIDHPDGLYDPAHYFSRLQQRYRERVQQGGRQARDGVYVVVEKITAPHERLPEAWAVHGTTGYRFANVLNGLFVDTRARGRLERTWRAFAGDEAHTFEAATYRGRRAIMEGALASQLAVLALHALRIARADRCTRDFTLNSLRAAIIEIVAHFPVYRTYVDAGGASEQDRRYVNWAVSRAKARSRVGDPEIFHFLQAVMLGNPPEGATGVTADRCREFAMRFQQFTAPVAAKGVEDTAFYTFNPLVSLNEVGGDPDRFGMTVRAFHAASADRAATWPHTLLATSTHDNKRSEDVRARIDVISEMPAAWRLSVRRWSRMNRSRKRDVDGHQAPSRNDEYLLYQTLIGSLPPGDPAEGWLDAYRERIEQYAVKAAREAKVHTSWLAVNSAYEDALTGFVAALLHATGGNLFLADLREQCKTFAWYGLLNSLSMTLLKLASPGVPDIYQGNEMLDWSLVDPDNRRPVNYGARRGALASLEALAREPGAARTTALFASPYDGRAKLWLVARALELRRMHPELFGEGDYRRIDVTGARADHVVAFARTRGCEAVLVVAGRLFASLGLPPGALPIGDVWTDTTLDVPFLEAGTRVANVVTGETFIAGAPRVVVADSCRHFPGALLHFTTQDGTGA